MFQSFVFFAPFWSKTQIAHANACFCFHFFSSWSWNRNGECNKILIAFASHIVWMSHLCAFELMILPSEMRFLFLRKLQLVIIVQWDDYNPMKIVHWGFLHLNTWNGLRKVIKTVESSYFPGITTHVFLLFLKCKYYFCCIFSVFLKIITQQVHRLESTKKREKCFENDLLCSNM